MTLHPTPTMPERPGLLRGAALACMAAAVAGCASVKMPEPTANAATVQAVRAAHPAPAAAGSFVLAPGKPAEMDKSLSGLRGSSMTAAGGSFAQQLKDELVAAMKAAGVYDERSSIVIAGQLTDSRVDAAVSTGTGRLAARFSVDRAGQRVFDKEIAVEASWPSSFAGAIALPEAINQYGAMYKTLVVRLFEDAQFRAALAK